MEKLVLTTLIIGLAVLGILWFKITDQTIVMLTLLCVAVLCAVVWRGGSFEMPGGIKGQLPEPLAEDVGIKLKRLKESPGSKLPPERKQVIKGILKDSIKRGQLNEFLASNNMCPSLTKLNSDRYREIGQIDELLALRALSLGLEIMLRNYCTWADIHWPVRSPTVKERILELKKRLILDDDAEHNYSEIFSIIHKICDSGEAITKGEALSTCLEKSDELINDYVDWLLKVFHPTSVQKEIEDMRKLLEDCQ